MGQPVSLNEKRLIRAEFASAAREVATRIGEGAAERDSERRYPLEQLLTLRESGLEAVLVPQAHGGPGGTLADVIDVTAVLSEGDPNIGHMYGNIHAFGIVAASNLASPALAAELNGDTVAKRLRWGNAFSEVGTRNAFHYTVKITATKGGWQLDGDKFYCTGSLGAEWLFVLANVEGTEDYRLCLVPTATTGVEILDDWSGIGQATTGSGTTKFHGVFLPDEYVLELASMLAPVGMASILAQATFSAVHLGIARNAMRDAITFVGTKTRPSPFSGLERAADDPLVLRTIGVMQTQLAACDAIHARMLDAIDQATAGVKVPAGHVACTASSPEARAAAAVATYEAKAFTGQAGLAICELLFQVCGASSASRKYGYDRHWRNLRTVSLHDPVDHKYRLIGDYHQNGALPPITAHT